MSDARSLQLQPSGAPLPAPPDRGRLMSAEEVAAEIFRGQVTRLWVLRNVKAGKVRIGHVKRGWWEQDVRRWLEQRTQTSELA